LTNAARRIGRPSGVLRREALVQVVVAGQHDVRAGLVERLPDRLHLSAIAVLARAEARMVPVGEGTGGGMGGEVIAQPALLRRARLTAAHLGAIAVDHDDVPRAESVAVVPFAGIAGITEVREVRSRAVRRVVVVARRRPRAQLVPTPGRPIALSILVAGARRVGIIA